MVITAADRRAFKRCRRAWDLGSRLRQGWEPDVELTDVDVGDAVRAALAVWYFPGMWEWGRHCPPARPRGLPSRGHRLARGSQRIGRPRGAASRPVLRLGAGGGSLHAVAGGYRRGSGGVDETFRRTEVRRDLAGLERVRHKLGCEARDMTRDGLAVSRRRDGTFARSARTGRRASPSTPAPTPRPSSKPATAGARLLWCRRGASAAPHGRWGGAPLRPSSGPVPIRAAEREEKHQWSCYGSPTWCS